MDKIIECAFKEHFLVFEELKNNIDILKTIAEEFILSLKNGGKIIFCGNGGSAADAQHLATELVGRFKKNRAELPAIAISTNTSIITAIGNDFGFSEIFAKQVACLANKNDVLVGISTSGNSDNVVKAIEVAKKKGVRTIGLLGKDGGVLKNIVDISLIIELPNTARIQEMHILAGHIVCEIVEEAIFGTAS